MSLERFRTLDEAARARLDRNAALDRGDLFRRIAGLWDFSRRLAPGAAPRGLFRFRSLEEAAEHRAAWVAERARRLRETRLRNADPDGSREA